MKITITKITIALFLFLVCQTKSQIIPQKKYHLGAFVRLQGHPNFDVTLSQFHKMMNDPDEFSFSFKRFLKTTSFGRLDYEFVSVKRLGIDTIPYYYDIQPPGFYAPFDSEKNKNGYVGDSEGSKRVHGLTERYIQFLNENLDPTVKLDGDGDGKVDIISFISPGLASPFSIKSYGGNWAGGIPHFNSSLLAIKGLGIGSFSVTIADSWKNVQANGIFKHEVGHNLKTWDYYDSNNTPEQRFRYRNLVSDPAGPWNMMTGASNTYGAYVIWSRLGFLTNEEVKVIHRNGTYRLNSLFSTKADNVAFRINSPNSDTEYFILEYRPKHKTFEWWHNTGGLVVSIVNPHVRGNPRGSNNPRAYELFYLRDEENNILFNNTSLGQKSKPRLALSDGTPAGFCLNNIRIENGKLVFDLVFDDKSYVKPLEYPELISSNAQNIEWLIETNPSNLRKWKAVCSANWLTLSTDYKKGVLRIKAIQNNQPEQRNAVITLSAPGADSRKAYLVQRGTSAAPALWLPEVDAENTVYIPGEEGSHNIRVIGDLDGSWWGGNQYITNGRGERQVLHNSVNSVYAYRNSTATERSTEIRFRLTDGQERNFKVVQKPAVDKIPVYTSNVGILPAPNDGKWYYVRTERGECTRSNYLRPVRNGDNWIVGSGFLSISDSLLWTIETSGSGAVILRNKAMGYLELNAVNENRVTFTKTKPSVALRMKPNVSNKLYYGATGYVFEGDGQGIKGLHMQLNGNMVVSYFDVNDFCTFFFDVPDVTFYKKLGNTMIDALNGYKFLSDSFEIDQLKQSVGSFDKNISEASLDRRAKELIASMNEVYSSILLRLSSSLNADNDKWFSIKRYFNSTWGLTLKEQTDEFLYFANKSSVLNQDPLTGSDHRYAFKFVKQPNGTFCIVNKANDNYYLCNKAEGILLDKRTDTFILRPVITFRGLKFAIVDASNNQYLNYNSRTLSLRFVNQPALNNLVNDRSYLFEIDAFVSNK